MTNTEPETTTAGFVYKQLRVLKGKNAPTLVSHGRARSISVPSEWTSVRVYSFDEDDEDRAARLTKEARLKARQEVRAARREEERWAKKSATKGKKKRDSQWGGGASVPLKRR
jgi:hypothetical protein